jgi:signal transduction histidine kinase
MAATTVGSKERAGARLRGGGESTLIRAYFAAVSAAVTLGLLGYTIVSRDGLELTATEAVTWVLAVAVTDLIPVPLWGPVVLTMSLPVLLALGMLVAPTEAALVALLGSFDPREFRREISLLRSLYNRSQVALAVLCASHVFHQVGGDLQDWPWVLAAALAALSVDFVLNGLLVAVPVHVMTRVKFLAVVGNVFGTSPTSTAAGYVCLGFLAVLIATVTKAAGLWALAASISPIALARLMFDRAKRLEEAARELNEKNRALLAGAGETARERRDERLALAGELHDEVLPPLFKVHLMGQVLRRDLDSGRLLELDEDLPELLSATDAAQGAIRSLVRDLRRSSLGPSGLNSTVTLLARQLEEAGTPPIELDLDDVGGSHVVQLLLYQVIREALSNAARHSLASGIRVQLRRDGGLIRLVVEDDGVGFDPALVDRESHFGLQLIAERVEAAGGRVVIDARQGAGTRIIATLPQDVA